jgi:hypothetical protein
MAGGAMGLGMAVVVVDGWLGDGVGFGGGGGC